MDWKHDSAVSVAVFSRPTPQVRAVCARPRPPGFARDPRGEVDTIGSTPPAGRSARADRGVPRVRPATRPDRVRRLRPDDAANPPYEAHRRPPHRPLGPGVAVEGIARPAGARRSPRPPGDAISMRRGRLGAPDPGRLSASRGRRH